MSKRVRFQRLKITRLKLEIADCQDPQDTRKMASTVSLQYKLASKQLANIYTYEVNMIKRAGD